MHKIVLFVTLPCLVQKLCQVLISAKFKMAANMADIKTTILDWGNNKLDINFQMHKNVGFFTNVQYS